MPRRGRNQRRPKRPSPTRRGRSRSRSHQINDHRHNYDPDRRLSNRFHHNDSTLNDHHINRPHNPDNQYTRRPPHRRTRARSPPGDEAEASQSHGNLTPYMMEQISVVKTSTIRLQREIESHIAHLKHEVESLLDKIEKLVPGPDYMDWRHNNATIQYVPVECGHDQQRRVADASDVAPSGIVVGNNGNGIGNAMQPMHPITFNPNIDQPIKPREVFRSQIVNGQPDINGTGAAMPPQPSCPPSMGTLNHPAPAHNNMPNQHRYHFIDPALRNPLPSEVNNTVLPSNNVPMPAFNNQTLPNMTIPPQFNDLHMHPAFQNQAHTEYVNANQYHQLINLNSTPDLDNAMLPQYQHQHQHQYQCPTPPSSTASDPRTNTETQINQPATTANAANGNQLQYGNYREPYVTSASPNRSTFREE